MKLQSIFAHTRVAMVAAMGMAALAASNRAAFAVEAPDKESPATGSEQAAHLTNEKMILSGDADAVKGSSIFDSQRGLFKLSSDGKKLLFYRAEPTEVNGRKGVVRLVLRDLTDGNETLLPFPALPKRWAERLPMRSFSNNPFDKTGTKIVLGVGIDTDENGIFDARTEKMQAVVFDSTTSKTKNLSATGSIVTAGYDNTGDRYIVSAIGPEKIRLLLADTDLLNWQEHVLSGVPRAISPSNDLIMLLKTSELNSRELPSELLLYDTKERKEVATLPAFKLGGALSMLTLVISPQWTTSGGHLHYIDIHGFPDDPRHGTRVWQRRSQTVIKELPNVVPIGPGPTKSSMVLMRVDEVKEAGSRVIGIVVHEALNNQTWEIPLPDTRILGTYGSHVIYTRKDKADKEAVYTAEIVLPKVTTALPEGGGSRSVLAGRTNTEAVYGFDEGKKLGFVMFTDIPSEGTVASAGSTWTGQIAPKKGLTVDYKGSVDGLDINGTEYKFANGRVFLVSTKEDNISVSQLNVPIGDAIYDAEIDRIVETEEVQRFLSK